MKLQKEPLFPTCRLVWWTECLLIPPNPPPPPPPEPKTSNFCLCLFIFSTFFKFLFLKIFFFLSPQVGKGRRVYCNNTLPFSSSSSFEFLSPSTLPAGGGLRERRSELFLLPGRFGITRLTTVSPLPPPLTPFLLLAPNAFKSNPH